MIKLWWRKEKKNNDKAILCDGIANVYLSTSLRFPTSINYWKLSYLLLLEKCFKTRMSGRVFVTVQSTTFQRLSRMSRHKTSPKESNNDDKMRYQVNNFNASILRELLHNVETTVRSTQRMKQREPKSVLKHSGNFRHETHNDIEMTSHQREDRGVMTRF